MTKSEQKYRLFPCHELVINQQSFTLVNGLSQISVSTEKYLECYVGVLLELSKIRMEIIFDRFPNILLTKGEEVSFQTIFNYRDPETEEKKKDIMKWRGEIVDISDYWEKWLIEISDCWRKEKECL